LGARVSLKCLLCVWSCATDSKFGFKLYYTSVILRLHTNSYSGAVKSTKYRIRLISFKKRSVKQYRVYRISKMGGEEADRLRFSDWWGGFPRKSPPLLSSALDRQHMFLIGTNEGVGFPSLAFGLYLFP